MRVAHGYCDRRMPEQLLDRHYIHASIQKSGSKCVPERVPRYTFDSRFLVRQSETRLEINHPAHAAPKNHNSFCGHILSSLERHHRIAFLRPGSEH